ncbi:hypothetical protein JZ751_010091 [Albula glossodonta]|uniref:Uncharacterized protein n=1 Tax=Albula glossodonta TaxID=121402 RepID=A0A8T2N7Z0_9TELE|nr:hypothetical protein JZ751_010091 [Albula glossodonta]
MAHLLLAGGVLLSLTLCTYAAELQRIEFDHNHQLTCSQSLTDCRLEDEDLFQSGSEVDVSRLELKALLCCRDGVDCRPCIQIHTHLTVTAFRDDLELSGYRMNDETEEKVEGVASGEDRYPAQTEASINVCHTVPNFLTKCKRLEFTLPPSAVEDHTPEMWLTLVVSEEFAFGSSVFVTVKSTHGNITVPAEKDVCSPALKRIVNECNVPSLHTEIDPEKGVATVQLDEEDRNYSFPMAMCQKYGEEATCRYEQWNSTDMKITIPLHSVPPCLCFQVWWLKDKALRVNCCPFVNYTEFLKNMLDNVSMSVVPTQTNGNDTALTWTLSAPCRVEAELWLCRMRKRGAGQECGEVDGSRRRLLDSAWSGWEENSQGHWGKVQGMSGLLGPWCPFEASRGRWILTILVGLLLICLIVLGAYLLQGWVWKCFKDEDIRGAVGGGQVVLLYPPDSDQTLPGLVCRLGSSLSALGFSVSLDLWSRGELSVLGPVPWLHSRLDRLQRHGGKVVLILTRAALERAEEWGRRGRDRDTPREKRREGEGQDPRCTPYADVFSASLSCILADYLQGRAGERFVLAQFESLPPLAPGNGHPLPELFRGLPLYSLPSQSLGFLTELAVSRGGPSRRRRAGGLRAASRALAVGLRGFGASGGFRLPGFSQGGGGSGVEDTWETVPLQPCHTPTATSPCSSPKAGNMAWEGGRGEMTHTCTDKDRHSKWTPLLRLLAHSRNCAAFALPSYVNSDCSHGEYGQVLADHRYLMDLLLDSANPSFIGYSASCDWRRFCVPEEWGGISWAGAADGTEATRIIAAEYGPRDSGALNDKEAGLLISFRLSPSVKADTHTLLSKKSKGSDEQLIKLITAFPPPPQIPMVIRAVSGGCLEVMWLPRPLLLAVVLCSVLSVVRVKTAPCQACRKLTENFMKGLERTANKNFGGGNTAWEEEKLAKYARSETRLLEIVESACETTDFDCNRLLEQIEDQVETWWFHSLEMCFPVYRQQEAPDLFEWLCIDELRLCCPPGRFGPDCAECPSGPGGVCGGLGRCEGEGTRLGGGECVCDPGYSGQLCQDCADGYYREKTSNHTRASCSACYHACKRCAGPEDYKCLACKAGWSLHDNKCVGTSDSRPEGHAVSHLFQQPCFNLGNKASGHLNKNSVSEVLKHRGKTQTRHTAAF